MQWSKIKTLFILCFLVLNIYLIIQFVQKQEEADVGFLEEGQEASIEERLESENIKYEDPNIEITEDSYISVSQKNFTDEELIPLANFENQTSAVINDNFILSKFEEPITIPEGATDNDLDKLVKSNILFQEAYQFWSWNKEMNVLIFFQQKDDRTFYYNENGLVLVFLNEENEMIYYTQTMLVDVEVQKEKKSIQQPIQAVGTLYDRNDLYYEDEITNIKMGYYARIVTEGSQVFTPTWRVEVNDERNYFINAIEGLVFASDDIQFIQRTIQESLIEKIRLLEEDNELMQEILTNLTEKLTETGNRSETE